MNTSLLVPAAGDFELPVSCVEHGRWRESGRDFGAGEAAYPRLRGQKAEQVNASYAARGVPVADQGAVCAEVADRHRRVGARSDTGAMKGAYAEREPDLLRAQEHFRCPADGPVGVIALVGGRAACADIFDRAETLRAFWPRLVRSYALEAIGARSAPPSLDSARRLLHRPLKAGRDAFPSPGLGQDVRISGNGVVAPRSSTRASRSTRRCSGATGAMRPARVSAIRANGRDDWKDKQAVGAAGDGSAHPPFSSG